MKQLLSILISLQLITLPVPLLAQSSNSHADDNAEMETNSDYDARSQGGAGYQGFAKQILGASTAVIGSNIITSCSFGGKVPSILTFMGGSIAYLISEISGGKKQNEEHKQRLENVEMLKAQIAENKGGGDVQRVLIEQRLIEEEKILEFVQERNKWGMAIMAIYTTAAILAIKEEMSGVAAGNSVGMSTCAAIAAKKAKPCGKKYPACYAKHMSACTPLHPTGQMSAKAAFMSPTSVATGNSTCSGAAIYSKACSANLKAYLAIAFANCKPLSMGNIAVAGFTGNLFSMAYGAGFGYAGSGNLQRLLQLAVTLTNMFTKTISTKITALYSYPIPRAATFGAHAAMMAAISMSLKKVASQTEENIEKLRKVNQQFRDATDDSKGLQQGGLIAGDLGSANNASNPHGIEQGQNSGQYQSGNLNTIDLKNDKVNSMNGLKPLVGQSKTCFSNDSGQMDVSKAACTKPVHVKPITVSIKQGSNKNLDTSVALINDLNRSLEAGNTDKAKSISSNLASLSSSLRSDLLQQQKEFNKNLAEKDKFDFAAEEEKILNSFDQDKQDILNAFEKEQGIKLASLSPSSHRVGLSDKDQDDPSQDITTASSKESIALANGVVTASQESSATADLINEGQISSYEEDTDLLFGGDVNSANPIGLNDDAYRAAKANGYLHLHGKNGQNEGIISQKENLFKVISNRYFLSYPKMMQRKIVDNKKTE